MSNKDLLDSICVQGSIQVVQTLHPLSGLQVVGNHILSEDPLHQQPAHTEGKVFRKTSERGEKREPRLKIRRSESSLHPQKSDSSGSLLIGENKTFLHIFCQIRNNQTAESAERA